MANSKKFIYGIAVVKFNSKEIGYIEKGSWADRDGVNEVNGADRPHPPHFPIKLRHPSAPSRPAPTDY